MPNEKLEKLKHDQYVAERKLTAAKHNEKRLENEIKRLTRSERTHRLFTHAGMLETFLREPTVLTDDDVMELYFSELNFTDRLLITFVIMNEQYIPLEPPPGEISAAGVSALRPMFRKCKFSANKLASKNGMCYYFT